MSELIEMPYGTGKTIGFWRTICLTSYPPQYLYECSKCSVCSKKMSNYCPYCGAEMQFLEKDFFEAYTEVQLDVEMKRKQCFVNSHCSLDCPNAEYEMADDRYGFGIADDMGLEKVSCKQCRYNTGRCEECLFVNSKDCPEYKESEDDGNNQRRFTQTDCKSN